MLGKTATSALEQPASAMSIDDLSPGKEEAWEKEQEDWEMLTLASSHRTSPRTQETNEAEASIPEQIEGFHVSTSSPRLPSSSRSSRASPHWRGEEITWERRGDYLGEERRWRDDMGEERMRGQPRDTAALSVHVPELYQPGSRRPARPRAAAASPLPFQIGRASCRARVFAVV